MFGKLSTWDSGDEGRKDGIISDTLYKTFEAGKKKTIKTGWSLRNQWWDLMSPQYSYDTYDNFMAEEGYWINNRIQLLETSYGLSFDSIPNPVADTPVPDPAASGPGSGSGTGANEGTTNKTIATVATSSDWQLYAGIGLILAVIGIVVYKKVIKNT